MRKNFALNPTLFKVRAHGTPRVFPEIKQGYKHLFSQANKVQLY